MALAASVWPRCAIDGAQYQIELCAVRSDVFGDLVKCLEPRLLASGSYARLAALAASSTHHPHLALSSRPPAPSLSRPHLRATSTLASFASPDLSLVNTHDPLRRKVKPAAATPRACITRIRCADMISNAVAGVNETRRTDRRKYFWQMSLSPSTRLEIIGRVLWSFPEQ